MKIPFAPVDYEGNVLMCRDAEIVDVAPHLASVATFVIHDNYLDDTYIVSNVESGGALGNTVCTEKSKSIELARNFLSTITVKKMLSLYKTYGVK